MLAGIRLLKRQWKKVLTGFVLLHFIMLAFIFVTYLFSMALMTGVVSMTTAKAGEVSQVLIFSGYINMALGIFAGGVQMIGSLAFVSVIFARFRVPQKEEISIYELIKQYSWYVKVGRRRMATFCLCCFFCLKEVTFGYWHFLTILPWEHLWEIWALLHIEVELLWHRKTPSAL